MSDVFKVSVEFTVKDREAFLIGLQTATSYSGSFRDLVIGYRADDHVQRRSALETFANAMEIKLRRNDSKRNWQEKPIEALVALMLLEVREFEVALEHFVVSEAKAELPDIANFAMMVHDRLSTMDQERTIRGQQIKPR